MTMTLAQRFGRLFPHTFLRKLQKRIIYAGFREPVEIWIGSRLILLLMYTLLAGLAYLLIFTANPLEVLAVILLVIILITSLFYLNLYYRILSRTRSLERILPDFLLLIAANLRAGMTPFGAFVKAVRPEFGELAEEAKNAGARVGGKRSLGQALEYLTQRFDSQIFERSMRLFTKGIQSGSQLARLLNTNAEEIRRVQDLREELISTTRSYMIFIGFVVIIVMPFLLSVSAFFLKIFVGIQDELGMGETAIDMPVPLLAGEIGLTAEEVGVISMGGLVLTSLFSATLMGVIRAGKWVYGIKYFPFVAIGALIFLFIADKILTQIIPVG